MRRNELAEERRERADDSFREHLPLAIHAGTPTTSSQPFLFDPYLGVSEGMGFVQAVLSHRQVALQKGRRRDHHRTCW